MFISKPPFCLPSATSEHPSTPKHLLTHCRPTLSIEEVNMSAIQTRITTLLASGVSQVVIDTLRGSMNDEDFITNTAGMVKIKPAKKGRPAKVKAELTEEEKAKMIEEQKRIVASAMLSAVDDFTIDYDADAYQFVVDEFMKSDKYNTADDVLNSLGCSVVNEVAKKLQKVKASAEKSGSRTTDRQADGDTIKVAFKDGIVRNMKVINQKERPFTIDIPEEYKFIAVDKSIGSGQVYFTPFTIDRKSFDDVDGTCGEAVLYQKSNSIYKKNEEGVWVKTNDIKPFYTRCGCKAGCKKKHEQGAFADKPDDKKVGKCFTISTNEGTTQVIKTSENAPEPQTTTPPTTPTPPATPTSQAIVVHTPSAPRKGRRKRPQSRGPRQSPLFKTEMNRVGFGIPRDNSDNIKDYILNVFIPDTGVTSKCELMAWCYREAGRVCPENGSRNSHVGEFYKLISEQCPNQYYSYESEDSANANIRVFLKNTIYS